jgi:DNA repair ATPase RecN
MTDDDYRDMVLSHDKHLDTLANSIESLANGVASTNRKLEDILDVISAQNVLIEKFTNLETNIKESFDRVHEKYRKMEANQNETGCPVLKIEAERLKVANKRIEAIENTIKWIVRTIMTIVIAGIMGLLWKVE